MTRTLRGLGAVVLVLVPLAADAAAPKSRRPYPFEWTTYRHGVFEFSLPGQATEEDEDTEEAQWGPARRMSWLVKRNDGKQGWAVWMTEYESGAFGSRRPAEVLEVERRRIAGDSQVSESHAQTTVAYGPDGKAQTWDGICLNGYDKTDETDFYVCVLLRGTTVYELSVLVEHGQDVAADVRTMMLRFRSPPPPPKEGAGPTQAPKVEPDDNVLKLPHPVVFEWKSPRLKPESAAAIEYVAAYLEFTPAVGILRVEVHTDAQDEEPSQQTLTEKRALAVVQALIAQGVDCKRLLPAGFGSSKPITLLNTPHARAANRRTVFVNAARREKTKGGEPPRNKAIGGMPVDGGGKVPRDACDKTPAPRPR